MGRLIFFEIINIIGVDFILDWGFLEFLIPSFPNPVIPAAPRKMESY